MKSVGKFVNIRDNHRINNNNTRITLAVSGLNQPVMMELTFTSVKEYHHFIIISYFKFV